jgi:hypothetical protein
VGAFAADTKAVESTEAAALKVSSDEVAWDPQNLLSDKSLSGKQSRVKTQDAELHVGVQAPSRHVQRLRTDIRAFAADPKAPEATEAATLKVSSGEVAWDPHNLLSDKSPIGTGRIEQRLAERRKQQQGKPADPGIPIHRLSESELAQGGVSLATAPGSDRGPTFAEHVGLTYMPINVTDERIKVLNYDPPVMTIDGFLRDEVCDAIIEAAQQSGLMEQSKVGDGHVKSSDSTAVDDARTSSSVFVTAEVEEEQPRLKVTPRSSVPLLLLSLNLHSCLLVGSLFVERTIARLGTDIVPFN